jgi:5'(3')-deoxyribonucleotidase
MSKPLVLLDTDGLIGDFAIEVLAFCNRYGRAPEERLFTMDDFTGWDLLECLKLERLQERLDKHMRDTDYCRYMPVLPGAREFVDELRTFADVVVCTSPYSAVENWCSSRVAWLKEHFDIPKRDVIFAKRKELVRGDWLIDDKPENVEAFRAGPGNAILFSQPWNREPIGGLRAFKYEHVIELIKAHQ